MRRVRSPPAVAALGYSFGEANKLSRPDSLSLDATTEAIYRYTGLGRVTGVSYVGISLLRAELTSYAPAELASGDFRLMAGLIS